MGMRRWIKGQVGGRYSHHAGRGWRREAALTEGLGESTPRRRNGARLEEVRRVGVGKEGDKM